MAADSMGVDYVWSAEAWGMGCPLAYIAAKTQHIKLGTESYKLAPRAADDRYDGPKPSNGVE